MSIGQILGLVVLFLVFVICLIFLLRKKLAGFLSLSLRFAFIFFLFLVVVSVLVPSIYKPVSDFALERAGVAKQVEDIDEFIFSSVVVESQKAIYEFQKKIFDTLKISSKEPESQINENYFKEEFYPGIVEGFASLLRIIVIAVSVIALILIVYASYATRVFQDLYRLQVENERLSVRLKRLEKAVLKSV
jgi:energy-coupling factor transporter transmembrane protein EcfT